MDIEQFEKSETPSIIKDPFNKNSVTGISVNYKPGLFGNGNWTAYGYVSFKNGETTGKQKFKGPDFDAVVIQIKAFLKTLN